ncbi:MAG: outer membrane beta-barrel protein [Ilyomonas sp.]
MIRIFTSAFLFVLLFSAFEVSAQEPSDRKNYADIKISIKGKVTDQTTNNNIPGATVQIFTTQTLSTEDPKPARFSANVISGPDGSFEFNNIPFAPEFTIIVSAVGHTSANRDVSFQVINDEDIDRNKVLTKDIGEVSLTVQSNNLGNVVVTSQKPGMQFGIDRKIFNVEQNITAQGGTAVDVMKNIPSLTVDVDGNVQMRNSSPQILIDGRPTILTLDQIPADNIERVELVTNPSAKYDASSSGGIINIVLKKNKRSGINGIASAGVGSPDVLNGNLNLNVRQNKINFFISGNYNQSGGKTHEETYRENRKNGIATDYFNQNSDNERKREFSSVRFGIDYFIDDKNTLSFTQGFVNGKFNNDEVQHQSYLDSLKVLDYTGLRTTTGANKFNRSFSRLSYDRQFGSPDNKLSADVTYNTGGRNSSSLILNKYFTPENTIYQPDNIVRNDGSDDNNQITAQIDYSNKISETKRIEFGARYYKSNTSSNFGAFSLDQSNVETKLPLSNDYKFDESVKAAYINYANKLGDFKYQVGLRAEFSKLDGELTDSALHFGYEIPDGWKNLWNGLFPSFFLTKTLDEGQEIQFNYSKRIRRPRFWEVNPFVDINDPLNIRQGNPALKPEFTNSFELNYFNQFTGGSFLGVVYFKNNVGDVTQYSDTISPELYQRLNNAAVSPNAILNTFINAGYTNRMGTEFTYQQKLWKGFDFTYNINLQYRTTNAQVGKLNLNNSGFNWDTKLIANYKTGQDSKSIFKNTTFQLIGNYEGPQVIPQGRRKSEYTADFAFRKEFLKNKAAALSFNVNDIFNTRRFGTIYDTDQFYQDSYSRWSVRTFRVTFSYKFGNADFNLFPKRQRDNGNNSGGDDGI